mgnify:CR=1 FL=1|tara:strand:- start:19 stop:1158 length:1140 start_codon:yes stop_codon:yes gene_type:complete
MQRAGQMAIEPTVGLLEDFVKKRTLCEFKFVQMYFQSGVAFVEMRKAVSDGKGGHIVIPAEKLRITFSPILDIKKPVTEAEVKVYQNRLMQMNPQLKPNCRGCIKAASEDPVAGNEYAWHTQNGYARSVVLKFPTFAAYCATGVCTLEKTIRKRKAEEPPPEAIKKTTTLLPGLKVSPYFKNVQPSQCPATSHDDSDEVVASPQSPSTNHSGHQHLAPPRPPPKKGEAPGRRDPPNACVQLLRTAATCAPLMSYLKAVKKLTPMGMPHWNAIKDWTKTEEGMAWLCMAQIDPLGVQLDHVVAQNGTASGYDSVFNCYFMPPAPNSWFGEYDTKEKRDYIGKQAVEISKRFTKWMKIKVVKLAKDHPELFDQSKFDPIIS